MDLILIGGFLFLLIGLANVVVRRGQVGLRRAFDGLLLLLNLPFLLFGLVLLLFGPAMQAAGVIANVSPLMGGLLMATAVWGMFASWYQGRVWLARWTAVDPSSAMHALALVGVGWLVGNTLVRISQSDLNQLVASMGQIDAWLMVGQLLIFLLVSVSGVGLFIRRDGRQVLQRLGLTAVDRGQLISGFKWMVLLLLGQYAITLAWFLLDPSGVENVMGLNQELQSDLDTVGEWGILALAAGVGEEILFRGALQPVLGWLATAVVFALIHVQYGLFTPASLIVLLSGLVLGHIRIKHNTTLAILVHAGYNFVIGLLSLLQP